jgi:hypothetical protein
MLDFIGNGGFDFGDGIVANVLETVLQPLYWLGDVFFSVLYFITAPLIAMAP